MDEETIRIPISEYETFRNRLMYQDKQSLIRELQQLLQDKDEDLKRYKDKLETTDTVLQRTQRQLDQFIQHNKMDKPYKLLVPRSMNRPAAKVSAVNSKPQEVELVARAAFNDRTATEHDETMSIMSMPASRDTAEHRPADHLKSLPIGLGMSGFAPGMSSALLQKLVTENLTLRKQLEALNNGKPLKLTKDSQVHELKFQLRKKQDQVVELRNQLDQGSDASSGTYLVKKVERLETTLDMNKVMMASLKEQKDCIEREKATLDTLLENYRTETEQNYRQAENRYNEGKITELENELELQKKDQENAVTKIQQELDEIKSRFELLQQERDMAIQNYEMVVAEFQNIRARAVAHPVPRTPGPISRHAFSTAPSSVYAAHFSSKVADSGYSTTEHPSRHGSRTDVAPPILPPRIQTLHRHTTNTNIGTSRAPPPPPRDKRMLKCPRCEAVFDLLQTYREHIKVCLKS